MSTSFVSNTDHRLLAWLEQSKREWVATFDAILDLIVIRGADGRIVRVNKSFADALNASPREIVGLPLTGLQDVHGGMTENPVIQIDDRTSHVLPGTYLISRSPILDSAGNVDAEVLVLRDITALEQMESRMRDYERAITIRSLAAGVGHEISNPMVIMSGRTSLLLSDPELPPKFRSALEIIQRQLGRVMNLTRTLRDLSAPRSEHREVCELESLIDEVCSFMSYEFARNRITLDRERTRLPSVELNRSQIIQVLINLFSNARDAMPTGGKLRVETAVAQGGQGPAVQIRVSDTGCGITDAQLSRLFTPFSSTKGGRGTGLGLYISKSIIDQHGGTIRVDSVLNQGTTFTIELPPAAVRTH